MAALVSPRFALFSSTLLLALGCGATGGAPSDGGGGPDPVDGGMSFDSGPPTPECAGPEDCDRGFVCAAVDGVPRCVRDPDPPPPGDGTDCRPCDAPGECRDGICIQPTEGGDLCEFDSVCLEGELCIAGRCTPDPRIPRPCAADTDCYAGLRCGAEGICVCDVTTDCPIGLVCEEESCGPGPGGEACFADIDCESGDFLCDTGRCRPRSVCDIMHPNLAGDWDLESVLRIREALPSWLDSFLEAVAGPFRFLAGDETCIDFGLPAWVETEICDLVRPFVDMHLPPWSRPVFRAIADLNDVLSEWHIEEEMTLEPGAVTDSYRGTHEWLAIEMRYRGMPIRGTPESILDWRFSPSPFNAAAVCGTFYIDRHDVHVSVGSIIAWAADTLVHLASEGRWSSVSEALSEMAGGFCDALASVAESTIDYSGVGATVRSVCSSAVASLIDDAIARLLEARIGASPITLRGYASVAGPNRLQPGVWDGTLLGRGFTGDFAASR